MCTQGVLGGRGEVEVLGAILEFCLPQTRKEKELGGESQRVLTEKAIEIFFSLTNTNLYCVQLNFFSQNFFFYKIALESIIHSHFVVFLFFGAISW